MKIRVIIIILLLQAYPARAQKDSETTGTGTMRLSAGAARSYNTILDLAVSPMLYSGWGYSLHAGFMKSGDGRYDRIRAGYQNAGIAPDLDNVSRASLKRGTVDWSHGWRVNDVNGRARIYTGGRLFASANTTRHEQWANNGFSFCFALSAGPAILTEFPSLFKNDKLLLAWELSFPLISYVIRPGISSRVPEGAIKKEKLEISGYITGGRITSIHEYLDIESRLVLGISISARIDLQLEYYWNYSQYTVNNKYQSANHLVGISFLYNLRLK